MQLAVGRVLRSGWIPTVVLSVLVVGVLLGYQTPAADIGRFVAYVVYGIALPGTLIWRALRSTPWSFVEDVAGGTAIGYAIELFVYLAARAAGVPLAVAVWPAVVIVAFLAVPSLRRHWRAGDAERAPVAWAWTIAGVLAVILAATAVMYYRWHGLTWPWSASPHVDVLYQLALASELKNHAPPFTPYVLDAPLDYHWFVHAHLAASSWVSGVELEVLLFRFFALPMLAAFTVLIALCAKRISGRWSVGALAAVLTFLVSSLSPYRWSDGAFWDLSLLEGNLWFSPTQTYAGMLFAAAVLLLIERLRDAPGGAGDWVLIALLLTAVMGAKATFLPLLLVGLGLVLAVGLVFQRRLNRAALVTAVVSAGLFVFASRVVFGGTSHALQFRPGQTVRFLGALRATGLSSGYAYEASLRLTLFVVGMALLAWAVRSAGMVGLLARRERIADPAVLLLTGISITGIVLMLVLRHPGVSQTYFIRSVAPYLAILSACGLAALVPAERATRRTAAYLGAAAVAGGLLAWAVPRFDSARPPKGTERFVAVELLKPVAVIAVVLVLGAIVLLVTRHWVTALRGISAALIVAAVIGLGIPPSADRLSYLGEVVAASGYRVVPPVEPGERPIPKGGIEAARWLRNHSGTSDLVATNTHCRLIFRNGRCDNRHFWISGFAERRVLVEGWGYTPQTFDESWAGKGAFFELPYWKPERLAENDRAFTAPSPETIGLLSRKYGVRWLFVDERYDRPSPNLGKYVKLRYRSGDCTVYEVPPELSRDVSAR